MMLRGERGFPEENLRTAGYLVFRPAEQPPDVTPVAEDDQGDHGGRECSKGPKPPDLPPVKGDKERAIADYRMAIELRPGDKIGTAGLKRLGFTP